MEKSKVSLRQKKAALVKEIACIDAQLGKDDPYGLIDFLKNECNSRLSSAKPIGEYTKSYYYGDKSIDNEEWFHIILRKQYIDEVMCYQLLSYLYENQLQIFNIISDYEDARIQIAPIDVIRKHIGKEHFRENPAC